MYRALSDAKNRTALPTSQPVPSIPRTEARTLASRAFSLIPDWYTIGVYTGPGATQFTRMPSGP